MTEAIALEETVRVRPPRRFRWPVVRALAAGVMWFGFLQVLGWTVGEAVFSHGIESHGSELGTCGEWQTTPIAAFRSATAVRWRNCEVLFSFHRAAYVCVEYEDPSFVRYENIQVELRWWHAITSCVIIMVAAAVLFVVLGELWRRLLGRNGIQDVS